LKCLIIEVCALIYRFKVNVLLDHGVSLQFISLLALQICWATFQAKNNVRSPPASSALTLSHTKAVMCILQIITYVAVENGIKLKGEQRYASVEP